MKILKHTLLIILAFLAVLAPIMSVIGIVLFTKPVYQNSFVGVLDEKFERLTSIEEDKVVVVGGSSVAFGLDSALMEEYVGMPVVNFGLYAAIGTKAMLDLSRPGIKEGDVVILAPELDRQTLSLYFSSENTLMALDGDYSMVRYIRGDNKLSLLGGAWSHATKKLEYLLTEAPDPEGIYNSDSFNAYGDVKDGLRAENVMPLYYDENNIIELTSDILDPDFADYVNEYIDYCNSRGATVYFTFCPINEMALSDSTDTEALSAFTGALKSKIDCEFISVIDSYIMEAGYFYDTNYHLNDAGVIKRTKLLTEDILLALGKLKPVDIEVPAAPVLPEADVRYFGEDENSKYFVYEQMENGAMKIVGLTDLGKQQTSLTVPLGADGYKVTHIGDGAFAGASLTSLTVTDDTNLRKFLDGSFRDCAVTDVWIYYVFTSESEKLSPASHFYGVTIHVPPDSSYSTDYDWGDSSGGYELKTDALN